MQDKLCTFTKEEEEEWRKNELLNEEALGLYSKEASPYWFKFSEYELVETDQETIYHIEPKRGAKLEHYKPFDVFHEILSDFFLLLAELPNNNRSIFTELTKNKTFSTKANEEILKFCNKYGLFGVYWEQYKTDCFLSKGQEEWTVPSFLPVGPLNSVFHNYRERTLDILEKLSTIRHHYFCWTNFIKEKTNRMPYPITFNKLNLGVVFENNNWRLVWNFQSLIEALSVMYLLNFTGQMGEPIKVCKLDGCNKPVRGRIYCCDRHGDCHRQRRSRSRRKIQKRD